MFLKRELAFLVAALMIAFVAKTFFPPSKKSASLTAPVREILALVRPSSSVAGAINEEKIGVEKPGSLKAKATPKPEPEPERQLAPAFAKAPERPRVEGSPMIGRNLRPEQAKARLSESPDKFTARKRARSNSSI